MNRLFVDNTAYGLTDAYRDGARTKRSMREMAANPFPISAQDHQDWTAGFTNEERCLHVADGIDVIEYENCGRTFVGREPENLRSRPKAAYLSYAHALMVASGALEAATRLFWADTMRTSGSLRRLLVQEGINVHHKFVPLIISRIYLESRIAGTALSVSELQRVQNMASKQQKFVLGAAKMQEIYYDQSLTRAAVGPFCGENKHWSGHMVQSLRANRLGFIVNSALHKFNLTTKGWEAVRVLRGFEPKAPTAKTSIIPTIDIEEDEPVIALRF